MKLPTTLQPIDVRITGHISFHNQTLREMRRLHMEMEELDALRSLTEVRHWVAEVRDIRAALHQRIDRFCAPFYRISGGLFGLGLAILILAGLS